MAHQGTARALEAGMVGRLAKFFPEATPVRIPIRLSRTSGSADAGANGIGRSDGVAGMEAIKQVFFQDTVIEFGTTHEVLFMVDHPLEFADRILLESRDGSLRVEASVVAVQYHPERTAVAARFLKPVPNWIVKS